MSKYIIEKQNKKLEIVKDENEQQIFNITYENGKYIIEDNMLREEYIVKSKIFSIIPCFRIYDGNENLLYEVNINGKFKNSNIEVNLKGDIFEDINNITINIGNLDEMKKRMINEIYDNGRLIGNYNYYTGNIEVFDNNYLQLVIATCIGMRMISKRYVYEK